MHILLIEDHQDLAENITEYFEARGDRIDCAADGIAGLQLASGTPADVIVLDLMLPGLDGLSVCSRLRERQVHTPILMLTAKDLLTDKITGFEAGADDYLVKPFSLIELAARLNALVRRAAQSSSSKVIEIAGLKFDTNTLSAERDGIPIKLNPSTRRILSVLMLNTHRVVTREELEQLLWGNEPPEGDVLRAHMHALRNAIDKGFKQRLLHTIHGTGYRIHAEAGKEET